MIIYTHEGPLKVGEVFISEDVVDMDRQWKKLTFRIMRVASREEYLSWIESQGFKLDNLDYSHLDSPYSKFYEVSAD